MAMSIDRHNLGLSIPVCQIADHNEERQPQWGGHSSFHNINCRPILQKINHRDAKGSIPDYWAKSENVQCALMVTADIFVYRVRTPNCTG